MSFNKIFAKLGSDLKKPDAVTVISKENFRNTIWRLPANELLYVGPATRRALSTLGIRTIGELARTDPEILHAKFGKCGTMLWRFANGYDTSAVSEDGAEPVIKSIGNSTTAPRDLVCDRDVKITLYLLAESVAARLREQHCVCSTVALWVRNSDLSAYIRQVQLKVPESNSEILAQRAYALYQAHHNGAPIRSLGIRASALQNDRFRQLSFLPEQLRAAKIDRIENAVDSLRNRFGYFCVQRGVMLTDKKLSALDAKSEHVIHPESFF